MLKKTPVSFEVTYVYCPKCGGFISKDDIDWIQNDEGLALVHKHKPFSDEPCGAEVAYWFNKEECHF